MSKSHMQQIEKELTRTKWVIHTDLSTFDFIDYWEISRPNGDSKHTLRFELYGNGPWGEVIGNEDMGNAIGCHISSQPQIDLYFGKFTGQFQLDSKQFFKKLNALPIHKSVD